MNKISSFLFNSFDNLIHKISWQRYNELADDTWHAILICIVMALVIGVFDILLKFSISYLYSIL